MNLVNMSENISTKFSDFFIGKSKMARAEWSYVLIPVAFIPFYRHFLCIPVLSLLRMHCLLSECSYASRIHELIVIQLVRALPNKLFKRFNLNARNTDSTMYVSNRSR